MTLKELSTELYNLCVDYEDQEIDPNDIIVKLALQPNYPMRGAIQNICVQHKKIKMIVYG